MPLQAMFGHYSVAYQHPKAASTGVVAGSVNCCPNAGVKRFGKETWQAAVQRNLSAVLNTFST